MTLAATSALAPAFTHTTLAPDVTLTFAAGSPVSVTLPTGSYRMWLAPSASCYLRALAAAIQAAILAAHGGAPIATATLSAAGVAKFTFASDVPATVTFAAPMWRRLGFDLAAPSVIAGIITGNRPVWHLALFASLSGYQPMPRQSGGAEVTTAGRVYTFAPGITSWRQVAAAQLVPWSPAVRAAQGCEGTALYPELAYLDALGSVATLREWSLLDVLASARNALCGVALGTWATLRTSTTDRLWRGYVDAPTLLSPKLASQDKSVEVWAEMELALSHPSVASTETRA